MGRFSFYAVDLLARTTQAAPSEICELFPAVVVPFFLNIVFNLAKPSIVVCFLIPSSFEQITYFSSPFSSFTFVRTGTIYYLNNYDS